MSGEVTRRAFIKGAAALSSLMIFGGELKFISSLFSAGDTISPGIDMAIRYGVCPQCPGECGIRCKLMYGRIIKIDGNPYHPNNYEPHISYLTEPRYAMQYVGSTCAKGQAGLQTLYDPLRLKQPLKRAGRRGEGKWKTISWDQAIDEIINGGFIFKEVPGEENRYVVGLREIRRFVSQDTVKADLKALSPEEFRPKYKNLLIDPAQPELGAKSNQLVYLTGRTSNGRKELAERFYEDAFGTANCLEYNCDLSENAAYRIALNDSNGYLKPDYVNSEFIVFFGTSPLEANVPMQTLVRKIMKGVNDGHLKFALADPRYNQSTNKASKWLQVIPGTDGALAMGIIRWIIENDRYDRKFLENPNLQAAVKAGETTWTNAIYLVRMDTGAFLRADEAGIGKSHEKYVVLFEGKPAIHDEVEKGELDAEVEVNGIKCKTAFRLLKESALKYSIEQYAQICGLEAKEIEELAREFTDHTKKAAAEFYRGTVQHTNGFYSALAVITLNFLIGNINWREGAAPGGGHWDEMKGKYDLEELFYQEKAKAWGVPVSRENSRYEDSAEFRQKGYPAKRPWFPHGKGIWQETIAGIAEGYPYTIKALILHRAAPSYSLPGMKQIVEQTLADLDKVPLLVSFDISMSETTALADYIFPDVSGYEQWATPHVAPAILTRTSGVRQPVVEKLYPNTRLMEDVLIEIAKKMALPGFGDNGLDKGISLNRAEDWYRRLIANIACADGGVPGNNEDEKIEYVLARGGRFEDYSQAYDGYQVRHKYQGICQIYSEGLATAIDSMTGKRFSGVAKYEPVADAKGNRIEDKEYPFYLITYKHAAHSSSITLADPYLMEILKENFIEIGAEDAGSLGVENHDAVRLISPTSQQGILGKARIRRSLRPGVIAVMHHFGHWQLGSKESTIDGKPEERDEERGKGVASNPVMRLDTSIGNVCLQDKVSGSPAFYGKVKIVKG